MLALKCLRCTNLKVQNHGDGILRLFLPLSCTRSYGEWPVDREHKDQKSHPVKQETFNVSSFGTNHVVETFYNMVTRRRDEALRSVLITFGKTAEQQVQPFLESLGQIKHKFFYGLPGKAEKYVLVEFSTIQQANSVLSDAGLGGGYLFPTEGRVLEMIQRKETKTLQPAGKTSIKWHQLEPTKNFLIPEMKTCRNVSEIMKVYLKHMQASELNTRLHFITCVQIERIFLGAFPKVRVVPFGSSVNGFGRKGCDLDISLLLNHRQTFSQNGLKKNTEPLVMKPPETTQCPKAMLQLFGKMLEMMLPSCSNVIPIPGARVPIIKFKDVDTGSECDLNCSGPLGICASEILYTLSHWDERCRALLFTVRAWARYHNISNAVSPSVKITNFSLLLLVVFFLQTKNVLPTIQEMEQLADDRDLIVYEGEARLFLRHVSKDKILQWRRATGKYNEDEASSLLTEFFSYYSKFPFRGNAITINTGNHVTNPTRSPMYIINPLDMTRNVARNVREASVLIFQIKCKEAVHAVKTRSWASPLDTWTSLFDLNEPLPSKRNIISELFAKDVKGKERIDKLDNNAWDRKRFER